MKCISAEIVERGAGLKSPASLSGVSGMKIDLTDDEARALHALLVERTNLPTKLRHSSTQQVYRAILMKLGGRQRR